MGLKISSVYLLAYNAFQFCGWLLILVAALRYLLLNEGHLEGLLAEVQWLLQVFQTAALLEVVHCLIGIVPASWLVSAVQVASRIVIVWGIAYLVPQIDGSIGVPLFVIPWSIAEVTRSAFYFMKLLNFCPQFLIWCRYSFFYLLYPLGVAGEVITIIAALPYIKTNKHYNLRLPNALNVSFSYYYMLIVIVSLYLPGLSEMYTHMIVQRRKVLNSQKASKQA